MDLTYPPEAEAFRLEIRAWLKDNLPQGWFDEGVELTAEQRSEFARTWNEKLNEGGLICASWPTEYGGKGLSTLEQVVLTEEFAAASAPLRADFFGDTLVGPTILHWGTEEQKHEFLPGIMSGQISWCQGFSEPNAGSDLASLTTRADLDGDEWIINGQKVWTTQAQYADYVFLLARTDQEASLHAGISYLLVPMHQEGVEVRPIRQIDGTAEFNEVFFTNARCPKDNVAMTTLGFERGSSATTGFRRFLREWEDILADAKRTGRNDDPIIRQRLVKAWTDVKIMQINGYRSLTDALNGTHHTAKLGACNKMFWSEMHRRTMELAIDILGMDGQILTGSGSTEAEGALSARGAMDYPVSALQASFFFSRSETIWGGAAEIQRNIVAEKALGLPKEPKVQR